MAIFKICPSCGSKNDPTLFECSNCEADITRVEARDEESLKGLEANAGAKDQGNVRMVKICECGAKNPPNARKCGSCSEDIFDIIPRPEAQCRKKFVLSSLDGQYAYTVEPGEHIIGRANRMSEYLLSKNHVGRTQARLILENDQLFVENMGASNPTFVNNKEVTGRQRLDDGDELGLGGKVIDGERQSAAAYFLVRID